MLYPMIFLITWTLLICAALGALRFIAVQKRQVNPKQYLVMSGYEEPTYLKKISRHYNNLLEQPILFYLACVLTISMSIESNALVYLSWGYLVSRLLHSFVHMGRNNALHRMGIFTISMMILLAIWIQIALQLSA